MLIGVDIGQSACKVTALRADGTIAGERNASYPTHHPHPGWAEQNPDDWTAAADRACRELMATLGDRAQIEGVGVTAAAHHGVILDASRTVIRPCILLSDGRAADEAAELERRHGDKILARGRNRITAGWTLAHLRWLALHEPEAWSRVRHVLFAKDYVRSSLTGDNVTDWIEAEGSLLLNAATRRWDDLLCELVPIDRAALPAIVAPEQVVGHVTSVAAARTGIPEGTPVVAGCSDTAAEAYAAGAIAPRQGVVKIATAGNVNVMTEHPLPSPRYFTYSHPIPGLSYHAVATNSAASSRSWLQHVLGTESGDQYAELDREMESVAPGSDGLLFHPYLLGERAPCFDVTLRASFVGIAAHHTRGHLLRAVLEGVALSLADCADVAKRAGLEFDEARLLGGGSRSRLWAQITADAIGRPLLRPSLTDASCGAALLAGVGAGVFSSIREAAERCSRVVERIEPDAQRAAGYARLLEIYRAVREEIAPFARALREVTF